MAKRKLSTQQARRLNKKRTSSADAEQQDDLVSAEKYIGLVITNFGKKVLIECEAGDSYRCSIRQHLGETRRR